MKEYISVRPDSESLNEQFSEPAIGATREDLRLALDAWRDYRSRNASDPTGWVQECLLLVRLGCSLEAKLLADKAVEQFPDQILILLTASRVYESVGNAGTAEASLGQEIASEKQLDTFLKKFDLLLTQKEWHAAEVAILGSLDRWSQEATVWLRYVRLRVDEGKSQNLGGIWSQLVEKFEDDHSIVYAQVDWLVGQGRFGEAKSVLCKSKLKRENSRYNRLLARIAMGERNWPLAIHHWKTHLEQHDNDAGAWLQLATCSRELGQYSEEERIIESALLEHPSNGYLRRALCRNLLTQKKYRACVENWEIARDVDPDRLESWVYPVHLRRLLSEDTAADYNLGLVKKKYLEIRGEVSLHSVSENRVYCQNFLTQFEAYTNDNLGWPLIPQIESVTNALVVPQDRWFVGGASPASRFAMFTRRQPDTINGGVYKPSGEIVSRSIHSHPVVKYVPDEKPNIDTIPDVLRGRWLYAGLILRHFGAFIVESLGRLWALERIADELDGVIFCCGFVEPQGGDVVSAERRLEWANVIVNSSAHQGALKVFCGELPIRIVTSPTIVDSLVIPDQLAGYGPHNIDITTGHRWHRGFVKRMIHKNFKQERRIGGKIYVSRSKIPIRLGFFFREDLFEKNLEAEGYEIIYPERMTFEDQISLYRNAGRIIIGSGSACHVLALAAQWNHKVAVLGREKNTDPVFAEQIRTMGASVTFVTASVSGFQPSEASWKVQSHRVVAKVDWEAVWKELQSSGFVDGEMTDNGEASHEDALQHTLERLRSAYGVRFQ